TLSSPSGCRMYETEIPVELELPELPEHWRQCFGAPAWSVVVPATGASFEIPSHSTAPPCVRLPKLQHQPVLAFPAPWGGVCSLPPAAGIYPLDLCADGRTLRLRWDQGPAGRILQRLLRQGARIEALNVPRLCREILTRYPADPWALDLDAAAAALVSGSFRVTDLGPLPCRTVELEIEPGRWFLESPFLVPAEQHEAAAPLSLPEVPLGFHRLFAVQYGWVADLWVDRDQVLLLPVRRSATPVRRSATPVRRSATPARRFAGPRRSRSPP
ncbi:MAG: hypothetical protein JW820_10880, partial [Spirochaetales bacterium]|nr:hypothetical protein [Spirochaetales bacterium]